MMNTRNDNTAEQMLIELNKRIGEAEKNRDLDFLGSILADGLRFRRANASIAEKAEYLEGVKDPANTYDYLFSEDVKVMPYRDVAVVSLLVRAKGTRKGKAV